MKPLGKIGRVAALLAAAGGAWGQTAAPPAGSGPPSPSPPTLAPTGDVFLLSPSLSLAPYGNEPSSIVDTTNAVVAGEQGRFFLDNGLASMAIGFFVDALSQPGLSQAARDELNLDLATAYLAATDMPNAVASAAAALQAVAATGTSAYLMRDALLQERGGQWEAAGKQLDLLSAAQLPPADEPWYHLAKATLAESKKDAAEAKVEWQLAVAQAATKLQAAQFEVALWRGQILLGLAATPEARDKLQKLMDDSAQDPVTNTRAALELAIVQDELGAHQAAGKLIYDQLQRVDLDKLSRNNLRLEYVLLDEQGALTADDPAKDQEKLQTILKDWPETGAPGFDNLVQTQKIALTLLANGRAAQNAKDLKELIDVLVKDPRGHPLRKQLYLLQMQLALSLKQYDDATAAAQSLLALPKETGRDSAREGAWRTLAFVAWSAKPKQYTEAAKNLYSLLDALPPDDPDRKRVAALLADLYYLNGDQGGGVEDYQNAARFYATVIKDPPPEEPLGLLLERAVESELKAGQLDEAIARIEQVAPQLDPYAEERWRAEYNVLSALSDKGRIEDAFKRLNHLLDTEHINKLPIELRLRLRWLDAKLAKGAGDTSALDKARVLQEEAEAALNVAAQTGGGSEDDKTLWRELAASGLLLQMQAAAQAGQAAEEKMQAAAKAGQVAEEKAQAAVQGNQAAQEKKYFDELQNHYLDTDSAVYGVFFNADELAKQHQLVEAEKVMKKLVDRLEDPANRQKPGAEFAPAARYAAALYSEASDGTGTYQDAMDMLNKFVVAYPKDPLIYEVRFKQGELLEKQYKFPLAFDVYDNLQNMLKDQGRPLHDELVARTQMARVICLITLAKWQDADPAKRQQALHDALHDLEVLVNQPDLPVVARVEAGWRYAGLLAADDPDKKVQAYGRVIALLNDAAMAELDQNPGGRFYLTMCLLDLGKFYETQHKPDDAINAFQMVLDKNLSPEKPYFEELIRDARAASLAPPTSAPAAGLP